jgi:hypothetical protein
MKNTVANAAMKWLLSIVMGHLAVQSEKPSDYRRLFGFTQGGRSRPSWLFQSRKRCDAVHNPIPLYPPSPGRGILLKMGSLGRNCAPVNPFLAFFKVEGSSF